MLLVKRYTKQALGRMYCPDVDPRYASQTFMRQLWLCAREQQHTQLLYDVGLRPSARTRHLTPLQVRAVLLVMGEP